MDANSFPGFANFIMGLIRARNSTIKYAVYLFGRRDVVSLFLLWFYTILHQLLLQAVRFRINLCAE